MPVANGDRPLVYRPVLSGYRSNPWQRFRPALYFHALFLSPEGSNLESPGRSSLSWYGKVTTSCPANLARPANPSQLWAYRGKLARIKRALRDCFCN